MAHYRRNFLTRTILRADIGQAEMLRDLKSSPLTDRLRETFPVVNGINVGTFKITINPTAPGIEQEITGMQWEHRKVAEGTKIAFLTPDHVSVEYGANDFDHFPPLRSEFLVALNALIEQFPQIQITRLGLRYVNQFRFPEGNPLDWANLISQRLVDSVRAGIVGDMSLVRSLHQLEMRREGNSLHMIYGIFNPEYPAAVSRREFLIDIDGYRAEVIGIGDVPGVIDELNRICETKFEGSIENGLRQLMEPIDG